MIALIVQKISAKMNKCRFAVFRCYRPGLPQDDDPSPGPLVYLRNGSGKARRAEGETTSSGVGVYYAATQAEAQACGTRPAAVAGGGNSAGQAALFLSRSCAKVHMLIRGDSLEASMSRYLINRIKQNPRIIVSPRTQVTALTGIGQLEGVRIRRAAQPPVSELPIHGLFVFIGAKPRTGWLAGQLAEDSHGFLLTGTDIPVARLDDENMNPLFLETSRPGIFSVGDVRSGSVKRAAAAIGDGSMAVRLVFDRLQSAGITDAISSSAPPHLAL
jgi:thioredoxin reductase (NADPH)